MNIRLFPGGRPWRALIMDEFAPQVVVPAQQDKLHPALCGQRFSLLPLHHMRNLAGFHFFLSQERGKRGKKGICNLFKKTDGGIDSAPFQLTDEAWRDFDLFSQDSKGHTLLIPEIPYLLTNRKNEGVHGFLA